MKETILFVDDEPNILQGLQRLLRPRRNEWDMTFVNSAPDAIALMKQRCFDVVVTDMRMPEMDGADLLDEVKKLCPHSVRIILSGQAEIDSIVKSIRSAHQYLSKPCDPLQLESAINRASRLRKIMGNDEIGGFVSQLQSIPAQPEIYETIQGELALSTPSIDKIAAFVSRDIGLSVKILQLTNSSFFGLKREVTSAADAVHMLGLDILRKTFSDPCIFVKSETNNIGSLDLRLLHERGVSVGNFALRISTLEGLPAATAKMCSTIGLICRVGCIVLAQYALHRYSDRYADILEIGEECSASVAMEQKLFGTSHSEIGGYLLSLWGLPDQIVNAASRHHECNCIEAGTFSNLTALQIAEHLASSMTYQNGDIAESFEVHAGFREKYLNILK